MNGMILDLVHFSVHDGPGIRSVLYLKGCPLRCIWCHSPESQFRQQELMFEHRLCRRCGSCGNLYKLLPVNGLNEESKLMQSRCPTGALRIAGKLCSAEMIIAEVKKDMIFFRESGGGLTISGGEALYQPDFTLELLKLAAKEKINCCIETCGFGQYDVLKHFLPLTEIFLFDFKAADPELHRRLTGVDNRLILENLRRLASENTRIHLRCPLIPGVNDQKEHLLAVAALAEELSAVEEVHIEPYNPMGIGRYRQLGRRCEALPPAPPSEIQLEEYFKIIRQNTGKPVIQP